MPKLVLIHGNATGIDFSIFARDEKYAEFRAFETEINSGEAEIYRWHYRNEKFNFWESVLPIGKFSQLYFEERNYCTNPKALNRLHEFIVEKQPEIILGHSLGAYQTFNYLNLFNPPASVSKIVLVQGAYPRKQVLKNESVIQRIEKGELEIQNFHSIYDQMMWVYSLAHFHYPGGLFGVKSKYIKNIEFTEKMAYNPHLWTIRSKIFRNIILNQTNNMKK